MEDKDTVMYSVYGTLRKGHGNHHLLDDSNYLGTIQTKPIFTMVDLGAFPAVTDGQSSITVEVYEVTRETEKRLFMLEGYRPDGKGLYDKMILNTEFGKTNIFIMHPDRVKNSKVIESGDWNKWKQKNIAG